MENNYSYSPLKKTYIPTLGDDSERAEAFIILSNYKDKIVWKNSNAALYDIGDDVVALQWNTKMNSIGSEVLEAVNKSIDIAEEKFKGLVIANDGANFSAGANVGMIFMFAVEQEYDELAYGRAHVSEHDDACTLFCYSCCSCTAWLNAWWWL